MTTYDYKKGTVEELVISPINGQRTFCTRPITDEELQTERERHQQFRWNWHTIEPPIKSYNFFHHVEQETAYGLSSTIETVAKLLSSFEIHPGRYAVQNMLKEAYISVIESHGFNRMGQGPINLYCPPPDGLIITIEEQKAEAALNDADKKCNGAISSACVSLAAVMVSQWVWFKNPCIHREMLVAYETAGGTVPDDLRNPVN